MNENTQRAVRHSFPLGSALGVAFVVLKLCNVIQWSWLWVLAPFWIPFAFLAFCVAVVLVVAAYAQIQVRKISAAAEKKKRELGVN